MSKRSEHNFEKWCKKYSEMDANMMADWLSGDGAFKSVFKNVKTGEITPINENKKNLDVQIMIHPARLGIFNSPNYGKTLERYRKTLKEKGELSLIQTKELHSIYQKKMNKFMKKRRGQV